MNRSERLAHFDAERARRILTLDGSMGAYLQGYSLKEEDYRGDRFPDHPSPLRGDVDLLCLTRPHIIKEVHAAYLNAGVDLIETNTFGGTFISQAEYGLQAIVREVNEAGARIAREACDEAQAKDGKPRLVAGSMGPTTKLLSLSPDVSDPARRDSTFDEMAAAYREQAEGLAAGGADILMIETITDTLNCKAALWGIWEAFDASGEALPIWISGTITDKSGRTLSGQTVEAFWNAIRHADPWAVGLNCALGPADMRQFLADLSRVAECAVACHPNAGLPNAMGGYDETPHMMEEHYAAWARDGLVNIIGGCCGTTPDHIGHMVHAVEGVPPRVIPHPPHVLRLSGLEPFNAAA
jgi:5-methyltetrahydrofolate--homocysteine methyltransferase